MDQDVNRSSHGVRRSLIWALALLAAVSAIVLPFSPRNPTVERLEIDSISESEPRPIYLVSTQPDRFSIEITPRAGLCDDELLSFSTPLQEPNTLQETRALQISSCSEKLQIWLRDPTNNSVTESLVFLEDSGVFPWTISFADQTLTITRGGRTLARKSLGITPYLNFWPGDVGSERLLLWVEESAHTPGTLHRGAWVLALVAMMISISLLIVGRRQTFRAAIVAKQDTNTIFSNWRLTLTVGITIPTIAATLRWPQYDEGWILARARWMDTQFWTPWTALRDPYLGGFPLPQGFWYESAVGALLSNFDFPVLLRAGSVISLAASWVLVQRWFLPRMSIRHNVQGQLLLLTIYFVLCFSWASLRPEALTLLLSLFVIALVKLPVDQRPWAPGAAVALAGLGLATHQSGLILLAPLAVVLVSWFREWRVNSESQVWTVIGFASALVLVFPNQALGTILTDAEEFRGLTGIDAGGFQPLRILNGELVRLQHLLGSAGFEHQLSAAVSFLAFFILIGGALQKYRSPDAGLPWGTLIASCSLPIGLLLTNSKWAWHYGAVGALGIMALLELMKNREAWATYLCCLLVGVFSLLALTFAATNRVSQQALVVVGLASGLFILGLLAVSSDRLLSARILAATVTVICLIGVTGAVAVESTTSWSSTNGRYSWLRQVSLGLVSSEYRCGLQASLMGQTINDLPGPVTTPPDLLLATPCLPPPRNQGLIWDPGIAGTIGPLFLEQSTLPQIQPKIQTCLDMRDSRVFCYTLLGPEEDST